MVLFEKELAIREVESIPIICDYCGKESTLEQPPRQICDALVNASYIYDFQQELTLLKRTQALFNRFPDSCHYKKLGKEYLDSERPKSQPDLEFEKALNEDTELKSFLGTHGFWLPARLKGVQASLSRWQEELDREAIRCALCNKGHSRVEPDFFDRLI